MLPMFLASIDQTLLATASPAIGREFGALGDTPWLALGYLVAAATTIPIYGRLGDLYGYRRMLCVALVLFGVGSLLGGLAPGMGWLVAARVLQGLGGGGLMVMSQALIGELVTPRERPRFQGWFAANFTLSSVAGPVLGGWVVHGVGWRWLFWGLLPPTLLAAWRILKLPDTVVRPKTRPPFDSAGVLGFAVTISATLVWVTFVGQRFAATSATGVALGVATLAGWGLLVWHERRTASPFLPLDVLALPGVRNIAATIALFAGCMFALVFFLPVYVQLAHGNDAADAGLAMLPLTLGMAVGALIAGRVMAYTRRVGMLPPWSLGLSAISVAALAVLPPDPLLRTIVTGLCGLGFGGVMPNAQIVIQTLAGRARLGAASAVVSLSRAFGSTFGTAVVGALAFAHLATASGGGDGKALVQAFHWAFALLAVLLAAASWLAWRGPRMSLEDASGPPVTPIAALAD